MHPYGGIISYKINDTTPSKYISDGCCTISIDLVILSDKRSTNDYPKLLEQLNHVVDKFIGDTYDNVSRDPA